MAKTKSECPTAIAKAVARMQEQAPVGKWESLHTSTMVRYIALDVLVESQREFAAQKPVPPAKPETLEQIFSRRLKAILLATPAICESSNLGKRLIDWGVITETAVSYE